MARLPNPGQDAGQWGEILNEFLGETHDNDGALKPDVVGALQLKANAVTNIALADGTIQRSKLANLGGENGIASLDAEGKLPASQVPDRLSESAMGQYLTTSEAESHFASRAKLASAISISQLAPASTPIVPPLSTDMPTVTFAQAADAALTGATSLFGGDFLGREPVRNETYQRLDVSGFTGFEKYFTGATLEIAWVAAGVSVDQFWVFIDDLPISDGPVASGLVTALGTTYRVKLNWSVARRRKITIYASSIASWNYALKHEATRSVTATAKRPVAALIGDSFGGGAIGISQIRYMGNSIARLLGVDATLDMRGGTGYKNPGVLGAGPFTDPARIAAVAEKKPQWIAVIGSVNDDSYSASDVKASAVELYAAYATRLPDVPLIVFGVQPSGATQTVSAARAANIGALKEACDAAPNVIAFVDLIGSANGLPSAWSSSASYSQGALVVDQGSVWEYIWSTSGVTPQRPPLNPRFIPRTALYTGTSHAGAPNNSGTRDTLLASDNVHPTIDGADALATYISSQIRLILLEFAKISG